MDDSTLDQLCIACNRVQSSFQTSCECGHAMKEAVKIGKDNTRKRRAPLRPNSVSSEWIGRHQASFTKIFDKKFKELHSDVEKNKTDKILKRKQKTKVHKKIVEENKGVTIDDAKKSEMNQLLNLIESSYQNIYFNRCKSYKKAKIADFDFEFDFSTFDSHAPFYPTALEDINTKINRENQFLKIIGK